MISVETLLFYPFFSGLDREFLEKIAMLGRYVDVEKGAWLFQQEDFADNLYLICEGKIALTMTFREDLKDMLSPHGKGEIIGWSALVEPHTYKLGAQAEEPSKVISFNGKALLGLMGENKEAGFDILHNLTEVIGDRLVGICTQLMSLRV